MQSNFPWISHPSQDWREQAAAVVFEVVLLVIMGLGLEPLFFLGETNEPQNYQGYPGGFQEGAQQLNGFPKIEHGED